MKVLHLTTHLNPGGITVYIMRLIKALRQVGVDLSVVSSGGKYATFFEERGAVCFNLPIRTKSELDPKLYLALPQIKKIVRDNHIDIIHAHTRVTQVMAYWVQRSLGIPVITTCHGFYRRRLGRRILPAWGDRVVAISHGVADHLARDHRVSLKKIRMIYNAIDFDEIDEAFKKHDQLQTRKIYGFQKEDLVIGVVARLVADKGHEYLIKAISVLREKYPSIRLLVVGDGPHRKYLEKLVTKMKLSESVFFLGNVVDVTQPLSAIDLFAFPATWREGFGLSIVEAMACNKPVIVTNVWALNSLIQHRENGMLVEPKNVSHLVETVTELVENVELRHSIRTKARNLAQELFSISRMAREIKELYAEVLSVSLTPSKSCL